MTTGRTDNFLLRVTICLLSLGLMPAAHAQFPHVFAQMFRGFELPPEESRLGPLVQLDDPCTFLGGYARRGASFEMQCENWDEQYRRVPFGLVNVEDIGPKPFAHSFHLPQSSDDVVADWRAVRRERQQASQP